MSFRFDLGRLVAKPRALEMLEGHTRTPLEFLARHASVDWGTLNPHNQSKNELPAKNGWRIISSYLVAEERSESAVAECRVCRGSWITLRPLKILSQREGSS